MDDVARCADLLYTEARLIDRQAWDDWLALYLPEAEFWVPAWDTEHSYVSDPQNEISLIYYADRSGLEDRVFRLRTGMSSASVPLPRTSHLVGNVQASEQANGDFAVTASWQVTYYKHKITNFFAGHYEYTLRPQDDGSLCIARKKIIVINDLIPQVLDFYHV
ncbi:aromatic-ring-hydroxylating dioxygenase subunit beta [Immundisolibacter sp.]